MKRIKLFRTIAMLFAIAVTTQSCLKDKISVEEEVEDVAVETDEIKFSDDFEWKTTQGVQLRVLPNANAVLYVKSADDKVYHKEFLKSGHAVDVPLTLPSFETELIVELAGQRQKLDLSLGEFNVVYN